MGVLTVKADVFELDGRRFDMWGIRTASASQTQAYTDHLIEQLDEYKAHGVNAVTVFYQGSSAGCCDPFSPDGAAIDGSHQRRMERIIGACDERGMVCIVGIFYQCKDTFSGRVRLADWDACRRAVRTATAALAGHENIIINIVNEQGSGHHLDHPWAPLFEPEAVIGMCRLVHDADGSRLVGGGGFTHDNNEVIGASDDVDVLLFDTAGGERSGALYDRFVAAGVAAKPIVNVEMFGAWTKRFAPPQGNFDAAAGRDEFLGEVDDAARREGLSVFFHANPWSQGPSMGYPVRYDLGGQGTEADPGIRWYFQHVRRTVGGAGRKDSQE